MVGGDASDGSPRTGHSRRIGQDALLEAGAELLRQPTLADLLSFAGVRAVAEQAGVRPGTITHRFPTTSSRSRRANPALAEAVARRAVARGLPDAGRTLDALSAEVGPVANGEQAALARIARVLGDDLFSHQDPDRQAFLTAYFACVAAAPHDADAARILGDHYAGVTEAFAGMYEALAASFGRRFVAGVDEETAAVAFWALAEGYLLRLRGDPGSVGVDDFAAMAIRLFDAVTTDAAMPDEPCGPTDLVPYTGDPEGDRRHRRAIVAAATALYDERGSWDAVTAAALAARAGVSRAVLAAVFPDRRGVAAAVWAPHLVPLREGLEQDRHRPLQQVLWRHAQRLAEVSRAHPQLAGAYLESAAHASASLGEVDLRNHLDPRAHLALPQMLVRILYDHDAALRPRVADTPGAVLTLAGLLTRNTVELALSEPAMPTSEIADLLVSLTLWGALRAEGPRHDALTD